jgi:hypothetical protein
MKTAEHQPLSVVFNAPAEDLSSTISKNMVNLKKTDIFSWLASSTHPIIDLAETFGINLRELADGIGFHPANPTKWHDTYFRNIFSGWQCLSKVKAERVRVLLENAGAKREWVSYAIMCTRAMCDKKFKEMQRRRLRNNKIVPHNP